MRTFTKLSCLPIIAMALVPAAAFAQQGLLDSLPKIRVGNGAPITGSNSSQLGIGVLTPEANRTPISVRILGSNRILGVHVDNPALGSQPLHLELKTPIDGKLNGALPK